ncbi:MAG: hypothetical protein AAF804_12440 [Bacteroidota bacterium]
MKLNEMTQSQIQDWKMFHLILEAWGWEDVEDSENRLEGGEMLKPEASRLMIHSWATLEARYHAPVNMVSLRIGETTGEDTLQAHFLFDNEPQRILEWIADHGPQMSLESFEEDIRSAEGSCEMILFERSNMEIYEVKPSPRA